MIGRLKPDLCKMTFGQSPLFLLRNLYFDNQTSQIGLTVRVLLGINAGQTFLHRRQARPLVGDQAEEDTYIASQNKTKTDVVFRLTGTFM